MTAQPDQPMTQISASFPIILLGVGAGCIPGLQPLLLDLLRDAGKLEIASMGLSATAEAAGMALTMTLAALFLPLMRLQ